MTSTVSQHGGTKKPGKARKNAMSLATRAWIVVPDSRRPPAMMTLEAIQQGRSDGSIPSNATVQVGGPDDPWVPVDTVLARLAKATRIRETPIEQPPTTAQTETAVPEARAISEAAALSPEVMAKRPMRGVLVVLVVVPPIWALIHQLALQSGAAFLLALWAFCALLVLVASGAEDLRMQTSRELIEGVRKRPAVLWPIVGVMILLAVCAWGSAIRRSMQMREIDRVLAMEDDCAFVERWKGIVLEDARREHDSLARNREERCERKLDADAAAAYAERCAEIAKRLGKGLTPEDERHIATGFRGETPDKRSYIFGDHGIAFARRIASGALRSEDLGTLNRLPCGPAMMPEYWKAASVSTSAWTGLMSRAELGENVRRAFGIPAATGGASSSSEAKLSPDVLAAVLENADQQAQRVDRIARSEDGLAEEELCLLAFEITGEVSDSCGAVKMRREQWLAKEKAAAAAAERVREAREAAEARVREAREAAEERVRQAKQAQAEALCKATSDASARCFRGCDTYWWNEDMEMRCEERCAANYPIRGCD